MTHVLPAACLSTFLPLVKSSVTSSFAQKNLNKVSLNSKYAGGTTTTAVMQLVAAEERPVIGLRVAAVTLTNNTSQTINLKNNLTITTKDYPKKSINFMPPALGERQAISVYFMYKLLHQKLTGSATSLSANEVYATLQTPAALLPAADANDVFVGSTKLLNVFAKLKAENIFYKTLLPGQTQTGLVLFSSVTAAPLRFLLA